MQINVIKKGLKFFEMLNNVYDNKNNHEKTCMVQ